MKSPFAPSNLTDTEHLPGDPIYNRACQDVIDNANWVGRGIVLPDKVIVHHGTQACDLNEGLNVRHIYE